mmetsp:Transcript_45198/g.70859  ORF Transcript_45198/g.70859 Transcript_45198/m.70859 type:complete len:495 (+) Transcript_45198:58-1542(+)
MFINYFNLQNRLEKATDVFFSSKNNDSRFSGKFFKTGKKYSRNNFQVENQKKRNFVMDLKADRTNEDNNISWIDGILPEVEKTELKELEYLRSVSKNLMKNCKRPSKNDESWKYYSLDNLYSKQLTPIKGDSVVSLNEKRLLEIKGNKLVFINGKFSQKYSTIEQFPEGIVFKTASTMDEKEISAIKDDIGKGETGIDGGYFSLLNLTSISDIYMMKISDNISLNQEIQIIYVNESKQDFPMINSRLIISAGKNSDVKLAKRYVCNSKQKFFDNLCTSIFLQKGSKFDLTLLNNLPKSAFMINTIYADLEENASLDIKSISLNGSINRTNLGVEMNGTECSCKIIGLTANKENNISDIHTRISHNFPRCESEQLQKNLVFDKAHAIFAGKIQVQNGAFQTLSNQLCKTLLLSEKARVDAVPILEINNEDVKCTHGATVSDLDDSQVFYIESRGISKEIAKKVLIKGFAEEVIYHTPENLQKCVTDEFENFLDLS